MIRNASKPAAFCFPPPALCLTHSGIAILRGEPVKRLLGACFPPSAQGVSPTSAPAAAIPAAAVSSSSLAAAEDDSPRPRHAPRRSRKIR
jgi:hypothetical protein